MAYGRPRRGIGEYISIYTRIPEDTRIPEEPKNIDPKVHELLEKGIKCLEEDKNEEVLELLTEAIKIEDKYSLLYINRAAAYAKLKNLTDALEDCETLVELRPDWPMAYIRKGTVLMELFRHRPAHCAFTKAYDLEPTNEKYARAQFEALTRLQLRKNNPYPRPVDAPLQDKSVQIKLRRDPLTKHLMDEPEFYEIIEEIRKNPSAMRKYTCKGDFKVAVCVAVARRCDVNQGEVDYQDLIDPKKHKELLERFNYRWVPEYSPVKEIYIPPPAPPKKKEPTPHFPLFGFELDSCMPSDSF